MGESQQEDWEILVAHRLIKQTETFSMDQKKGETRSDRGGDAPMLIEAVEVSNNSGEESVSTPSVEVSASPVENKTTFAKLEKSLMSIGFFTPSSRRIKDQKVKHISFTRTINGKKVEATVEFHPSAVFGLPITADQDKFLALNDIITNILRTEGKVTNPIRFTSAQLLRLLNSRVRAGKNYKDISDWLDVMTSTTIISNGVVYETGKKGFAARDRFHVFHRAVTVGKEMPDGSIADANYIWLSDWQLENINQKFLLPIDLQTYRELKNHIAKALVPLLQIWLFASQRAGSFEKRYDELCEMLSLQVYKAPSLITRQLKPSLDELVHYEYLKEWRIEKTSDRKEYKIIFFHGPKFHRDRRRQLDQKQQLESGVVVAHSESPEPELPLPGKLEPTTPPSVPKRTLATSTPTALQHKTADVRESELNQPEEQDLESQLVDELSMRGIMPSVALKTLRAIPSDELHRVGDYIDYWDAAKKTKEVGQGFLISLIREGKPLPANFETRQQRRERLVADDRRRKMGEVKEALKSAYEEHCRQVIDNHIADQIPPEEFERRVATQKAKDAQQGGFAWNSRPEDADQVAKYVVRKEIAQALPVPSYEEFRRRELPRILTELNLDPVQLGIDLQPMKTEIP